MKGDLFSPPPLLLPSPVHQVPSSYSADSFSGFSTRAIHRVGCSPATAISGSRSSRAKEEDEELFRDLFENDAEAEGGAPALTFLPQKPATRRTVSSCGNPNPKHHLTPMKPVQLQAVLSSPFIPRLKLEELVNARPDEDVEHGNNNSSQRISRRGSDLEQVTEEDENCFDDAPNESKATQTMNYAQATCNFPVNNERHNNAQLDQETLQFLEKLDLKAVLQTPRPEILSFYPSVSISPTSRHMTKVSGIPVNQDEDYFVESTNKEWTGTIREKGDAVYRDPVKNSRGYSVASRLAYMENTYGTAPIARKARRETIDRLANPITGHSSTLQALSPKQREKREAALTSRALLNPISAAIAVSCRRGPIAKKAEKSLLNGLSKRIGHSEVPVPSTTITKRHIAKQKDPLVHKRRSNLATNAHVDHSTALSGRTRRKSKTTLGSRTLGARKEALKNKLQSQCGATKLGGNRPIGGSTFLTQRDDEEGIELIEDFIARHRGAAQASLTFRSGRKVPTPSLSTRNPATTRSRPRPPQTRREATFPRGSSSCKSSNNGQVARSSWGSESRGIFSDRKVDRLTMPANSASRGPTKLFHQPRRPQPWQTVATTGNNLTDVRAFIGRQTTPGGAFNPLRRLKVHPPMPTLVSRAPKPPASAATTLLIGSTPPFNSYGATADGIKRARKKGSARTSTGNSTSFNAPTKVSEQRKRTLTNARPNGGEKIAKSRQKSTARRSTSRV